MIRQISIVLTCLLTFAGTPKAAKAKRYDFDHEHVLGTSLSIAISCNDVENAQVAEARALAEIDHLALIFSTYDAASEFSRWQQTEGVATAVSPELFEILAASDRWRLASGGAFQPGVETITRLWLNAAKLNQAPSTAQLQQAAATANQLHWKLDRSSGTATRSTAAPLTLDAIAKGYITERALAAAMDAPEIQGALINLGGDMRIEGDIEEVVCIADPRDHAVNALPIAVVRVANRAIATSGDYRRGFEVAGVWHSHIIDPRSGLPATRVASATVIANSSTEADALATLCNILPIEDGLALVESIPGAAGLIVTSNRRQFHTANWSDFAEQSPKHLVSAPAEAPEADTKPITAAKEPPASLTSAAGTGVGESSTMQAESTSDILGFVVDFEINRHSERRSRRPYVAVWLENDDGLPVKTAVLWLQTERPGPRWHRDLSRWYRNEGKRKLVGLTPLIGTVASATRGPGKYQALFDGTNDEGMPLKSGKYTLFLEAAREHGTYQLIRHEIMLGREPIAATKLKGNVEIKSASVAHQPKPAADPSAAEK